MLKPFALANIVSRLATGSDSVEASFNTYQWNRLNVEAKNGKIDRSDWYEWWYYKVVVPEQNQAFYFVYGVVNPWDLQQQHAPSRAYVSFGSFQDRLRIDKKFPVRKFSARYDQTWIQVADNIATDKFIRGAICANGHQISWDLQIEKNWGFNAMGWLMPIRDVSDIYWYPTQADAYMSGVIHLDGKIIKLNRNAAYQDRNWGRSFPVYWAWLVSNHFPDSPQTALAAGGGKPKVLGRFPLAESLSIGLKYAGQEFIFRPTDGDRVYTDMRFGKWEVTAINRKEEKIEISASAPKDKFMLLKFVTPQGNVFYDYQTLQGRIDINLYRREKSWYIPYWSPIVQLSTDAGGIEFGSHESQDIDLQSKPSNYLP